MRKTFNAVIGSKQHEIDVSWDLKMSGGGRVVIDGVEKEKWYIGVKMPGAERHFQVGDVPARLEWGVSDFDLYLNGEKLDGTRRDPPDYPSRLPILAVAAGVVLLGVLLLFVVILSAGCDGSSRGSEGDGHVDGGGTDAITSNDADTDAYRDAGGDGPPVFVVVVGEHGSIAHCDFNSCGGVTSPVDVELDAVAVVSPDRAFAVGSHGTILHWNGSTWSEQQSPTSMSLSSVDAVAEDLAFAVGEDGIILRYDGIDWTEVASPVRGRGPFFYLADVEMLDGSFGMAAGGSSTGGDGLILRFDGADWTIDRVDQDPALTAVGLASRDCAAAGGYAPFDVGATAHLLAWDGNQWTAVEGLEYRRFVTGIAFGSDQLGFGVTDGGTLIARYDGEQWTSAPHEIGRGLMQVHMIDESVGFAVGGGIDHPDVLRWDGNRWSLIDTTGITVFTPTLWGVSGVRVE